MSYLFQTITIGKADSLLAGSNNFDPPFIITLICLSIAFLYIFGRQYGCRECFFEMDMMLTE